MNVDDDWDEAALWACVVVLGGILVRRATRELRDAMGRIVAAHLVNRPIILPPHRRALPAPPAREDGWRRAISPPRPALPGDDG